MVIVNFFTNWLNIFFSSFKLCLMAFFSLFYFLNIFVRFRLHSSISLHFRYSFYLHNFKIHHPHHQFTIVLSHFLHRFSFLTLFFHFHILLVTLKILFFFFCRLKISSWVVFCLIYFFLLELRCSFLVMSVNFASCCSSLASIDFMI